MKIFHTADWHLGKLVQGTYMTEDQAYILQQFISHVEEEKPDLVIIAGDLYDRAIPPLEAVQLLNETLERIVLDLHIPVIAIAGNHDSPNRLEFGSSMMRNQGFHVVGTMKKEIPKVTINDEYGPVHFYLVPYTDPSQIRTLWADETIRSFDDAMKTITKDIEKSMNMSERNVFIGHAFVTPYGEEEENTSDSEKPLSIGGAEYVSAENFEAFDYTALGHLHQAHNVGSDRIQYAGSILKYSLSEEHHKKGYLIIDLLENNEIEVSKKLLKPRRDLRTVKGKMADILQSDKSEDYIFVQLTDEQVILHPMEKIRSVYPNAMQVTRVNDPIIKQLTEDGMKSDVKKMTDIELFQAFYMEINETAAPDKIENLIKEILDEQIFIDREEGGQS